MTKGRLLSPKLFIEGIEVPFEDATFTHTVNSASVCYINMPSHKSLKGIKPRSLVQLFVRDYSGTEGDDPMQHILAWEGDVFGFEMMKAHNQRSFRINCIDFTSYWDNILSYFFNAQQSVGSGASSLASSSMDRNDAERQGFRVESVIPSTESYYRKKIEDVMADPTKDFMDAVLSIYNDIALINDFYSNAEERLRISDRIKLKSSGNLANIIAKNEGLAWFKGILGRSSGMQTLRQTVNDLMGMIFHDGVTIPFPARVTRTMKGPTLTGGKDSIKTTIGEYIFKPNLYMMPPPMCNTFFPDEYTQFTYSRNFFEEPSRLIYAPELPAYTGAGVPVSLTHVYEPPSFNNFMLGKRPVSDFQGSGDFQIPQTLDPGSFQSEDTSKSSALNNGKRRSAQFLTNEELTKGIWLSREGVMPSSSAFRAALDDFDGTAKFEGAVARYLFFKKRFQKRNCQVTTASLKMSVVPGFPCLILDDSEADQNVVAYVGSVTHRISSTSGGFTQVSLTYAREVNEQEISTTYGSNLLIPPWFDQAIFGEIRKPLPSEASSKATKDLGVQFVSNPAINDYYGELLGTKGSKSITALYPDQPTLNGAVTKLIDEYKSLKLKNNIDVLDAFIHKTTARDYIRCWDVMRFIGAESKVKDLSKADFVEFNGEVFRRTGKSDQSAVIQRRNVIVEYAEAMKTKRGFRG